MPSERNRAYFYRLAAALLSVLIIRGLVSKDEASLWLEVVSAALGLGAAGLAAANTSTKR